MSNTKSTTESQTRQRSSQSSRSSRNTAETAEAPEKNTANSENPDNRDMREHHENEDNAGDAGDTGHGAAAHRPSPMEVLRQARGQLAELTGMTAESVSSFERTEEGWALEVEVLELERVPDTMSLMATYQVELDHDGQLTGYRRVRRYERGRADARRSGG